jgi:hypothetical protein
MLIVGSGKSKERRKRDVFLMAETRGYFRVLYAACGRVISHGKHAAARQSQVCAVVVKKIRLSFAAMRSSHPKTTAGQKQQLPSQVSVRRKFLNADSALGLRL